MRYLDSGDRSPSQTLQSWLASALEGASYFGCQTGYFNGDGLYAIEAQLRGVLSRAGEVHLVVGANEDSLTSRDLGYALDLLESHAPRTSLVVVSAADVLMHSKTYYVERPNGSKAALVGSANLTPAGLAANIEAGLAVESDSDSSAPFSAMRAAIDIWRSGARRNGFVVTRETVGDLIAEGVLDQPRPITPRSRRHSRRLRRLFPPLGAIQRPPRRPSARAGRPPAPTQFRVAGAPAALPVNAVGIVKQLSNLDVKGFRGERGTPYIALPTTLLHHLPTQPAGRNDEPRFDVPILARLDSVITAHVASGTAPTNVTGVGMGSVATSHRDLRLNILRVTVTGIEFVALNNGAVLPEAGDYVLIELPVVTPEIRLTFITDGAMKARAELLCDQPGRLRWGWLPQGFAPSW